ncbi:MAG: Hsp20/alpha crystallin family protein [Thermodesulfovibrionales bacterium]|jgi:HSP20 family protein|nr:Hsp20/alpha crystallin family protein [Thermodesulfovibrionales bacterium]
MKNVLKGLFYYEAETCTGPLIDIYETADDLVFEVDLPGIDLTNLSVMVYEDLLIIEGMMTDTDDELQKYLCMERGTREFRRVMKIPIHVNTVAGDAFYSNGVVTVKFPKLKGKLIKIKIEKISK